MKFTKKKAMDGGLSVLTAIVAAVGIGFANNHAVLKGDKTQIIAAIAEVAIGYGLQFTDSDIAKAAGLVVAAQGTTLGLRSLIKDKNTGGVKPDPVSQNLAKAVVQANGVDLSGLGMITVDETYQPTYPVTSMSR